MAGYSYSALEVVVTADTRGLTASIKDASNTAGEQASSTIGGHLKKGFGRLAPIAGQIGKAAASGLAVATTAAVAFGVKAYKAAEESNKVAAQTAAVIKSTGGAANVTVKQINALTASIMAKTGIDDEAVKSGTNMLLTFTKVRNESGKGNDVFNQATHTLTDMTAAMTHGNVTQEAMSHQAIQLGKALNDPIKGVSALARVGVTFDDQQKAQIKTLVDSGNQLGAQKIILRELNKEFGGTAAATATTTQRIKTAWGELQESVGGAIGKAIDPALSKIGKLASVFGQAIGPGGRLAPIMNAIGAALGRLVGPVGTVLTRMTNWIAHLDPSKVTAVADAIKRFGPAVGILGGLSAAFTGAGLFSQLPVIGPLLTSLLGPLKSVIGAVGGLKGAFGFLTGPVGIILTIFTTLMTVSPAFRNAVMGLVQALIAGLMPAFTAILAALKPLLPIVVMLARTLGAALAPVIKALTPLIVQLTPLLALLGFVVAKLLGLVITIIGPVLKLAIAFEKWYIIRIIVPLLHLLVSALTFVVKIIIDVVKWIFGGSPGLIPAFVALQRIVVSVTNIIRSVVVAGFTAIRNAIVTAWRFISTVSVQTWNAIRNAVTSAVRNIVGAVSSAMGTIRGLVTRGFNAVVGVVTGLAKQIYTAGSNAIKQLLSGMAAAIAGIGSWVKSHIVDPVVNAVKKFFGIRSPSAVMADLGQNVSQGFIKGIVSTNPLGIAKSVFGSIPNALGAIVSKGILSLGALPGKALRALGSVGGAIKGLLGNIGGFLGGIFGGGGGSGVSRWGGLMHAVLRAAGIDSLFGVFMSQMATESGGNPAAINLWDSNAKAGIPSQGLMQVIPPTFAAYAGPYRNRGILDPLANIYAAVHYAISRYGGNLAAVLGHGHGYASGGVISERITGIGHTTGRPYFFGERGPELVSPLTGPSAGFGLGAGMRSPTVINVYPAAHQSETEIAAMVSRRLAWAESTGMAE